MKHVTLPNLGEETCLVAGGGARDGGGRARPPDAAAAPVQVRLHQQEDGLLRGRRSELRGVPLLPGQRQALVDLPRGLRLPPGMSVPRHRVRIRNRCFQMLRSRKVPSSNLDPEAGYSNVLCPGKRHVAS